MTALAYENEASVSLSLKQSPLFALLSTFLRERKLTVFWPMHS